MKSTNYKIFKIETGILFTKSLTVHQIENIFEEFLQLEGFDGVKKIDKGKVVLTKSDNSLKLVLTKKDLRIIYTNVSLSAISETTFQFINDLTFRAHSLLPSSKFKIAKYRTSFYSSAAKDRVFITNEIVAPKYINRLESFNVSIEFNEEPISTSEDVFLYMTITNRHTVDMHRVFEELNKTKLLGHIVSVDAIAGVSDVSIIQLKKTFNTLADYYLNMKALEKVGYGSR